MVRKNSWATLILGALTLLACKADQQVGEAFFAGPSHVRFWLLVDGNGLPLTPGTVNAALLPVTDYTHSALADLAIPVALSLAHDAEVPEVEVRFEAETQGSFTGYSLTPADGRLRLSREAPVDTIFLHLTTRWPADSGAAIRLQLTEVSAATVRLGSLEAPPRGRDLTLTLGELDPTYHLSTNRLELTGERGETRTFTVNFPTGYLPAELPDSLFTVAAGFDFDLVASAFLPRAVQFTLTLRESLSQPNLSYETRLQLRDLPGYRRTGSAGLTLIRPPLVDRDNSLQTAAAFYNLQDPFHRTYGVHWFDANANGTCTWQNFFAFTYPVVVSAEHPHAILYDDRGTADPADDIYHHAFRIGFNSPNAGNTTNSFGLKRWFSNESTSSANSPGFNITEALEFYPEGGDHPDRGRVVVIPQDIGVGGTNGNRHVIAIEGEGTYERLPAGHFELRFDLRATNQALFGGTRIDLYYLYNTPLFPDPPPLTTGCAVPIDL